MGKPIRQGGLSIIYLVNKGENQAKKEEDCENVVKIEQIGSIFRFLLRENDPLFSETHFYINCAKEDQSKF
jgi:hypothetical protein